MDLQPIDPAFPLVSNRPPRAEPASDSGRQFAAELSGAMAERRRGLDTRSPEAAEAGSKGRGDERRNRPDGEPDQGSRRAAEVSSQAARHQIRRDRSEADRKTDEAEAERASEDAAESDQPAEIAVPVAVLEPVVVEPVIVEPVVVEPVVVADAGDPATPVTVDPGGQPATPTPSVVPVALAPAAVPSEATAAPAAPVPSSVPAAPTIEVETAEPAAPPASASGLPQEQASATAVPNLTAADPSLPSTAAAAGTAGGTPIPSGPASAPALAAAPTPAPAPGALGDAAVPTAGVAAEAPSASPAAAETAALVPQAAEATAAEQAGAGVADTPDIVVKVIAASPIAQVVASAVTLQAIAAEADGESAPLDPAAPVVATAGASASQPAGVTPSASVAAAPATAPVAPPPVALDASKVAEAADGLEAIDADDVIARDSRPEPALVPGSVDRRNGVEQAARSEPAQPARQNLPPQPVADQIAVRIVRQAQSGEGRISLQLRPETLGVIDVDLQVRRDGTMRAVISVERPETLEWLKRDAQHLERALQDVGMKTDSGSLNFALREQRQDGFGGFARSGGRRGSGAGGGGEPAQARGTEAVTAEAAARRVARGGVDVRI